jgi:predicted RNase H-like HicB family nuclease
VIDRSTIPRYTITIYWSDEDGVYVAIVPDLPGCSSVGINLVSVCEDIILAIDEWIEASVPIGREMPKPTKLDWMV